jgi:hypothetical protein
MRQSQKECKDFMIANKEAENKPSIAPTLVEKPANYFTSYLAATKSRGSLITPEKLIDYLGDERFITSLERTGFYGESGYIWFWTGAIGTNLNGYHAIDIDNKSKRKKLRFVSMQWTEELDNMPFNRRVYFHQGNGPISVDIWKTSKHGGVTSMSGVRQPMAEAPVMVYMQDERSVQMEKTANDAIMIPGSRFYAARKVYLRKKNGMDPQLLGALRPLFED